MSDYLANIRDLPVMPEVASKILGLGRGAGEISFTQLEEIIKVDVGLTAKILKIANSALYARQREIRDLRTAITMLGFKNIKTLVLLVTASGLFHIAFAGRPSIRISGATPSSPQSSARIWPRDSRDAPAATRCSWRVPSTRSGNR